MISKIFCHLQVCFIKLSLRRAIKLRHFFSGDFLILLFYVYQFFFKGVLCRNRGHVGMMIGMIAYNMSLICHSFYQFWTCIQIISNDKKCGWSFVFFQSVQNSRRIAVFISCIKCKIKDFIVCLLCKICIILGKFFSRYIGNRRFPFFLKTKPPVGGGRSGNGL